MTHLIQPKVYLMAKHRRKADVHYERSRRTYRTVIATRIEQLRSLADKGILTYDIPDEPETAKQEEKSTTGVHLSIEGPNTFFPSKHVAPIKRLSHIVPQKQKSLPDGRP